MSRPAHGVPVCTAAAYPCGSDRLGVRSMAEIGQLAQVMDWLKPGRVILRALHSMALTTGRESGSSR
jgi:hypothetical protein